jgi:RND family efflux transporter MFP subunit
MPVIEAEVPTRAVPVLKLPTEMSPRSRRLLWVGLGAVSVAIVTFILLPPRVAVTALATMPIRDEAVGTGFVQAKVTIGVGAKINGVIVKTHVDQGDVVKKGQILAELQNQDYRNQVEQAATQIEGQEAGLNSARAIVAASKARLQASVSAIAKAEAGLQLAEINYRRAKTLYGSGVVSKESQDSAETASVQAQQDVKNAEALRSASEGEVKIAEAGVNSAEKSVAGAQSNLGFQKANLQYTIVNSPVDGYVVTRDLEEGATVVPGLPIFTIADSSVIWVAANIDERELEGLKPGQPATIALRSAPQHKIAGYVARIGKQADPVTEELEVDVAFTKLPPDVHLNETAEVNVLKAEKGANVLPRTAVVQGHDSAGVWIIASGRLQQRAVSLGIRDKRGFVEVLAGLSDTDSVLVQPSSTGFPLIVGKRVRTARVRGGSGIAR